MMLKSNPKIIMLFIALFVACNSNETDVLKTGKTTKDSSIVVNKTKKTPVKKEKLDTINKHTEILSCKGKKIFTNKGEIEAFFVKKFSYNQEKAIFLYKINNDNNFFSDCMDPVCALVLIVQKEKILNYTNIPLIYDEEFNFLFKDENNRYFFEHYSSPAGYVRFYIIDIKNNKIYKTNFLDEDEKIIKHSFNFKNNTFKVRNKDKVNTKRIIVIKS